MMPARRTSLAFGRDETHRRPCSTEHATQRTVADDAKTAHGSAPNADIARRMFSHDTGGRAFAALRFRCPAHAKKTFPCHAVGKVEPPHTPESVGEKPHTPLDFPPKPTMAGCDPCVEPMTPGFCIDMPSTPGGSPANSGGG